MTVYRDYLDLPEAARGAVVALGNFDGVHRGHAAVIAAARALAAELDAPAGAAVFSPHPRRLFQPDAPPFALMTDAQRVRALKAEGCRIVHHVPFTRALAGMSPAAFVEEVLVGGLGLRGVVTGADFCFGKNRAGDAAMLAGLGAEAGLAVRAAEAVTDAATGAAEKISSSAVRQALREGDVERAAALLGRPWAIEGGVEQGDQRGRTIGFPTANIPLGAYLRPAFGVYAVRARIADGTEHAGVANLGVRPTVAGTEARLEAHLFDFDGDLYGQSVECALLAFLRPERKFDSFEALTEQIARDSAAARARLGA